MGMEKREKEEKGGRRKNEKRGGRHHEGKWTVSTWPGKPASIWGPPLGRSQASSYASRFEVSSNCQSQTKQPYSESHLLEASRGYV